MAPVHLAAQDLNVQLITAVLPALLAILVFAALCGKPAVVCW